MALLRFNQRTSEFVVTTMEQDRASGTGLTLSTTATGPNGEPIYFTKDPYAALNFYKDGDAQVRDRLSTLWGDYEKSWALESPNAYPMGNGVILRPYQNAGIDYCLSKGNALIGDAPGVGKTFTGIGLANATDAGRILVITPGRIRKQWRDNIKIGSTIKKVRCYPVMRSADGIATWANYVIISYDLLRNPAIHEALCALKWDLILADEAHMLKEISAHRTQMIFGGGRCADPLIEHTKRIVAMTGTPLPNRPRECYTLSRAICWDAIDFMSAEAFRYRFNPSARMETGYVREEKGRLPELQARLRCNFMVRRLKKDVLPWLPDKSYEFSYIESDGHIAEIIKREQMLDFRFEDLKKPWAKIDGELSTLRREMGEAKVPQAIEHMKYLLDVLELPKVVMFSHHRSVMDRMREALRDYGVVEMRGGMSDKQTENSKLQFMTNPAIRIFSGQLDAAGVGLDGLQQVASHCVIIEPAWTPGANEQAIDRLHRDGQHGNVIAQFLVVEGSLDERILGSVLDKTFTIHDALDERAARWI